MSSDIFENFCDVNTIGETHQKCTPMCDYKSFCPHAYTQTHVRAYTHMVSASRKLPSQKESSMPPTNLSSCLMNYTKQKSKSERLDAALLSWSLVDDSIHVGSSTTEFCRESPRWIKTHDRFWKAIVIQVQKQLRVDLNPPKNYFGRFLSR